MSNKEQYEKELENKANKFLIDNSDEIEYLPFCVIASSLNRHVKHNRKIYNNFSICSDELQEKILIQANYSLNLIENKDWDQHSFEELSKDIQKHKLGRNLLNDSAKYFYGGFEDCKEKQWTDIDNQKIFKPIDYSTNGNSFFQKNTESFSDYIEEYLHFLYSECRPQFYNHNPLPPIDYLFEITNFRCESNETLIYAYVIMMVKNICIILHNNEYTHKKTLKPEIPHTGAKIETYEDAYYDALAALYNTYYTTE